MMFVLSAGEFWGATWYMLNQLSLDRGRPRCRIPPRANCSVSASNCWAAGNAGEMDFLEPAWDSANSTATYGYRASYSTQYNQIGRCFNGGVNGGGFSSENFLLTASADIQNGSSTWR